MSMASDNAIDLTHGLKTCHILQYCYHNASIDAGFWLFVWSSSTICQFVFKILLQN